MSGWIVALLIALIGWLRSSNVQAKQLKQDADLQRTLLRKQTAIQLLNDSRFESAWVDALRRTSKAAHEDGAADKLKEVAERYFANDESDDECLLCNDFKLILNYFEFISIAILNDVTLCFYWRALPQEVYI